MNATRHIAQHIEMHQVLDRLVADFIDKTGKLPSQTSISELLLWSQRQTTQPDTRSLSPRDLALTNQAPQ